MIFIRNINLFIEQDKNQNKNSIRHKIIHSKGKKYKIKFRYFYEQNIFKKNNEKYKFIRFR